MKNKLFKIDRNKFLDSFHYIQEITKNGFSNIDFTGLIGRDLTEEEKENYLWVYKPKSVVELINIIITDYIEHRINE